MKQNAFTLLEVVVVIACASVLLLPAVSMFSAGSSTSIKGMKQSKLVFEASLILEQTRADISAACLPLANQRRTFSVQLEHYIKKIAPAHFQMHRFPKSGSIARSSPKSSLVSYFLEPHKPPKDIVKKLIRVEEFSTGKIRKKVLSDRVVDFTIGANSSIFVVHLLMADGISDQDLKRASSQGLMSSAKTIIRSFYGTAFPTAERGLIDPSLTPNWHSLLVSPKSEYQNCAWITTNTNVSLKIRPAMFPD